MTNASVIKHWAQREAETYRNGEDRPLSGYLAAMGVYAGAVTGMTLLGRRLGFTAPQQITPWDVALFGIATHRVTRTITKDAVVSPVRAPFTTYSGLQGPAELREEARTDSHLRHAVGELLTCPFCLAQWVATMFGAGLVSSRPGQPGWWPPPSPSSRSRTSCNSVTAPRRQAVSPALSRRGQSAQPSRQSSLLRCDPACGPICSIPPSTTQDAPVT